MRFIPGYENRHTQSAGALLLALAILAAPATPTAAQSGDEAGEVVTQLDGIRIELKTISQLLQTFEKHQQVTLLMTRIRLKQQRLSLLESQLREARGNQENMEQELEHMEVVENSYFEGLDRDDFGAEPPDDAMQKELEFIRQQKKNLESRLQGQRAAVIELENELARAREDVLALEETVDEQLGLR